MRSGGQFSSRSCALAGVLAALVLNAGSSLAEEQPLFSGDAVLRLTIEAPFKSLLRSAPKSEEAYPGTLVLEHGEGARAFEIKLSPRGLTRRNPRICDFPPLKVDFDKDKVGGSVFAGQNTLKLVTHCKKYGRYQEYYLKEFIAYKLYNALTPLSFGVRMAEITYRDLEGKRDDITRYGFFIEDVDDVAGRNGLVELEPPSLATGALHPRQAALFAVFQYMIGNLDWSFTKGPPGSECCHNAKLAIAPGETPGTGNVHPVPYDFDYSGLVDASYALPPEEVPVRRVKDRHFWGLCRHNGEMAAVFALFRERRSDLEAAVMAVEALERGEREDVVGYIADFFEVINDPREVERKILRRCRG